MAKMNHTSPRVSVGPRGRHCAGVSLVPIANAAVFLSGIWWWSTRKRVWSLSFHFLL